MWQINSEHKWYRQINIYVEYKKIVNIIIINSNKRMCAHIKKTKKVKKRNSRRVKKEEILNYDNLHKRIKVVEEQGRRIDSKMQQHPCIFLYLLLPFPSILSFSNRIFFIREIFCFEACVENFQDKRRRKMQKQFLQVFYS